MTIAATSPAVLSGPTTGPSHAKAEYPAAGLDVTTTGRDTVPFGASVPRSVLMPSSVSCSFSTAPPLLAVRTSAIFARMLAR